MKQTFQYIYISSHVLDMTGENEFCNLLICTMESTCTLAFLEIYKFQDEVFALITNVRGKQKGIHRIHSFNKKEAFKLLRHIILIIIKLCVESVLLYILFSYF